VQELDSVFNNKHTKVTNKSCSS